ncbi:serine/threonine-protein kinase [Slackia isoflavoniconvertens]|uniref:serine/threonine-protein kinase n=1 Tax=Slackia isoflavoniconvertens TaxID=572010 RepID=UPI003A90C6EF
MQNLILNRYRPLEEAGAGGFATVLAAWDTRIQRRVAIKCLRLDGYASPADARSPREIPGLDEARTAAMLSDSHIVGVYDFDASGAQAYLIMEYMDGITLTELMREEGALSLDVATCVFEAVAGALETAHENQVLHLDIKPDNVLINRQGQVKVADFGLSQLSHAAGYGRAAGGTIGYMPLEQMRLEACDARTDEWALAALTYEMLVGENPFRVPGLDAAERAIEQAEVFVPSMVRGDLNEEVDEALFGALAIDRDDRFDSVELFADAMLPHMGDARRGARELAVLVGEACDDGADCDEGCGAASAFLPGRGGSHAGLSMIDRIAPRTKSLVARLWAAVACGFAVFEAAANIPACMTIAGRMEPAFWGVVGVAVAAALAWPGAGAAFAVGTLVAALALSGSPFLALALTLAGLAWLAFGGARHHACANVGITAVLAGAFGFAPVVPLLAGYFLNVKHAFAATAFAVVSAFCLACAGSLDLTGWNVFAFGAMPGASAMEDAALSLVASPNVWAMAVSWLVAAVVGSLLCARGNRGLAACGMLAATTILVLGVIAATRLGGADFPDVAQLAPALVAGIAMVCATPAGVPSRE